MFSFADTYTIWVNIESVSSCSPSLAIGILTLLPLLESETLANKLKIQHKVWECVCIASIWSQTKVLDKQYW